MVNVSKSQYYELRHNIMNLGNQNSKYSWLIRDLENPQTGTHFRKLRLNRFNAQNWKTRNELFEL